MTDSVASIYLRQLNARGLLGVRRGHDAATKAVLKKIRKSGDSRRDTWRECGPMKPRKGRLRKSEIKALRDAEE